MALKIIFISIDLDSLNSYSIHPLSLRIRVLSTATILEYADVAWRIVAWKHSASVTFAWRGYLGSALAPVWLCTFTPLCTLLVIKSWAEQQFTWTV